VEKRKVIQSKVAADNAAKALKELFTSCQKLCSYLDAAIEREKEEKREIK
jgi:hypothetical protein